MNGIKCGVFDIRTCAFLFFTAVQMFAHGQDTRVVVENAKYSTANSPVVLIKWYSKELVYDEGVNVYRKTTDAFTWEKINTTPIRKKNNVAPSILRADPDMEMFVTIIKSASKQELQEDMTVFNVVIKSIQSDAFADFMGIYYEDKNVQSGKIYEYRINKIKGGKEFLIGVSTPVKTGAYTAGAPIEGLEVFQKGKKLNLNWKHEEDRFYAVNVYRKSSADTAFTKLNANPLMLSMVTDSLGKQDYPKPMFSEDRNLQEKKSYTYQLAGVGFFGNETERSAPFEVLFADVTPPLAPEELTGKADSMKVHLHWKNRNVDDLKGMNVFRSKKSDGPYEIINKSLLSFDAPYYHDTLELPGPNYYFISAVDDSGNEAHSNLIFVEVQDVIPPAKPEEVTLKADTGKITLTWKMGKEGDLAGYYIYRTVDRDQKKHYVLINAEPLKADHFSQELPKNVKNKFFYYLVAVDTSFNRSKQSEYVSGAMPDILPPEKPFIKHVSYQDENIVIEWTPNVDADLKGYHIYRAHTSKVFRQINVNLLGRATFRYTDRDNNSNTDYFYHLVAVDSAGNLSPTSREAYGRRVVKEDQPIGTIDLKVKYSKRKKYSQLIWNEGEANTPIIGYVVYRGDVENRLQPITGLIKSKSFLDKKIISENKQEQYYQVRAYAERGVIYSIVIRQKL